MNLTEVTTDIQTFVNELTNRRLAGDEFSIEAIHKISQAQQLLEEAQKLIPPPSIYKIEELIHSITHDWGIEDWEEWPVDVLRYRVGEWIETGVDLNDMFLARFEFEKYMGW